jgi:hypothetical protein
MKYFVVTPILALMLTACGGNDSDRPYASLVPKLSGAIPLEVSLPPAEFEDDPVKSRPFFDTFSWQSFIALSWPADPANRGIPLEPGSPTRFRTANTTGGDSSAIVWETYREGFELFPSDDSIPPEWNSTEPTLTPAGLTEERVLAMVTKGGLLDEVNEAFGGPLVDQNRNYVRYEVRINQIEYDQVRNNAWYDKDVVDEAISQAVQDQTNAGISPQQGIEFDVNALELKGAWRQLTDEDDHDRYYVVEAIIKGEDGTYAPQTMGLVGLHIMQKTEIFPQWIWSTFEHVDNVSGVHPSFNNGTDEPASLMDGDQPRGYNREPTPLSPEGDLPDPESPQRDPVQVTRALPIPSSPADPEGYSTQDLNLKYQELLAGTVWENYELVGTQWPLNPSLRSPYDPDFIPDSEYASELAGNPFPQFVSNVSMETYFQTDNSCMQCHYHAAAYGVDYSWILYDRVIDPQLTTKAAPSDLMALANAGGGLIASNFEHGGAGGLKPQEFTMLSATNPPKAAPGLEGPSGVNEFAKSFDPDERKAADVPAVPLMGVVGSVALGGLLVGLGVTRARRSRK